MTNFTENITVYNKKKFTEISIPSDSKIQYVKGTTVRLYKKTFTAGPGNYYTVPPNCVIKSKNKELYTVLVREAKDNLGRVISSTITINYKVPKDNILPKHTGDNAIIDFKVRGLTAGQFKITNFDVDTSYVTSSGERRVVTVSGDHNAAFEIIIKNAAGTITNRLANLRIPKPLKNSAQGIYKTTIAIPESSTSTTYTVEIVEGENSNISDNITTEKTINQYGPSGINVSFSSTTATSLVVTGTTPVAVNGITVGEPGDDATISWAISKSGPAKIYAHRQPVLSREIDYNTDGSSDWTNTNQDLNGGTIIIQNSKAAVQTSNTVVTLSFTMNIESAGTSNVSPVLNLDNFISTTPPAFGTTVACAIGGVVDIDLGSENNTIPIDSNYMTGGWSTVAAPSQGGSLSSYGAYDSETPGVVRYTAESFDDWTTRGRPTHDEFTYRVNDGTTNSATKTVIVNLEYF